jgi:hypothetical protein
VRNKNRQPHGRISYGSGVHATLHRRRSGSFNDSRGLGTSATLYLQFMRCTFHSSIAKSPLLTFPTSTSIHLVFSNQPSQMQVPGFYSWEIAPRPAFGSLDPPAVLGIKIFCWDLGSLDRLFPHALWLRNQWKPVVCRGK